MILCLLTITMMIELMTINNDGDSFKRPLIVFVKSDYILYQGLLNFAVASPGLRPNETNHATTVYLRL